jgi:hypothetical protein
MPIPTVSNVLGKDEEEEEEKRLRRGGGGVCLQRFVTQRKRDRETARQRDSGMKRQSETERQRDRATEHIHKMSSGRGGGAA